MSSHRSEAPWLASESPQVVWFSGTDTLRFLNDLLSQDIESMEDGESRRSMLLTPQGKLHFLLWVIKDGDRLGLMTEDGRGEALAEALGRYRIRVDVAIEVQDDEVWLVIGPHQGFDVSWQGVERHLVVGQRPDLSSGQPDRLEELRVESGEPRWGVDVDEATIPHESGLVPLTIDFTKGCFLGQELVARIDSRGAQTPRRLHRLESADGPLAPGSVVARDDEEVGRVTSAAGRTALAMLKRGVEVGDTVSVGGFDATVKALPHNPAG